jgi:hypothetical protein
LVCVFLFSFGLVYLDLQTSPFEDELPLSPPKDPSQLLQHGRIARRFKPKAEVFTAHGAFSTQHIHQKVHEILG